jgi:hypothetical protein
VADFVEVEAVEDTGVETLIEAVHHAEEQAMLIAGVET